MKNRNKVGLIEGPGVFLQTDETFLHERGVMSNQTNIDDKHRDTTWILCIIDPHDNKNFYVNRLADRHAKTLTPKLAGWIGVCTQHHTEPIEVTL